MCGLAMPAACLATLHAYTCSSHVSTDCDRETSMSGASALRDRVRPCRNPVDVQVNLVNGVKAMPRTCPGRVFMHIPLPCCQATLSIESAHAHAADAGRFRV